MAYPQGKAPVGVAAFDAGSCCGSASILNTPDVQYTSDMLDAIVAQYCIDEHATVELCIVEGGQHDWFGGGSANGTGDLVNTDRALEFFAAHPMP